MKPYKSGKYIVGNRFLMDLERNTISFHCMASMERLARSLPPDEEQPNVTELTAEVVAVAITDEDRLAVFSSAIAAALAKPAPASGCRKSQIDPFWGTGEEFAREPLTTDMTATQIAAKVVEHVRVVVDRGYVPVSEPKKPEPRVWTQQDQEMYQLGCELACAAYHEYGE